MAVALITSLVLNNRNLLICGRLPANQKISLLCVLCACGETRILDKNDSLPHFG